MTNEELDKLIEEVSAQVERLSDPEKSLTKDERNEKFSLQLQKETLERMKNAKEKGNLQQEIKAGMDYALFKNYGKKHPFLVHFIKSQLGWYGW